MKQSTQECVFKNYFSYFSTKTCVVGTHITPGWRQSKTAIPSTNVDKTSLEAEFSIFICRQSATNVNQKTLFLSNLDPRPSIVKSVFDCRMSGVQMRRIF